MGFNILPVCFCNNLYLLSLGVEMIDFIWIPLIEQSLNSYALSVLLILSILIGWATILVLIVNTIEFLVDKLGLKIHTYFKVKNSLHHKTY